MHEKIDFDEELTLGYDTYNKKVGDWWYNQSLDRSHKYAYKNIVKQIANFYKRKKKPQIIIDYACGPGNIIENLVQIFPNACIIGLDGSKKMLSLAKDKVNGKIVKAEKAFEGKKGIWLVETSLPNFSLPKGKADLVVFIFPNICPTDEEQPYYDKHGYKHKDDQKVAKALTKMDKEDKDKEETFDGLMTDKVVTRNIHKLLKKEGINYRVDYSDAKRENLSEDYKLKTKFQEGSLGETIKKIKAEKIFELLNSNYFKSKVIIDVYHQTKDEDDKQGGYIVSFLKAI